nr:ribonuclease H-like domain-containing protein [Tanacetum cinerariifolium]
MNDAKEMWESIKSIFGGNDESKKMQKYLLKQQFESFSVSNLEGLHKGYDRFQSLWSQPETHGAGDTLLESVDQKGIKTVEGEMQETLDTRQGTMERDLENRMNTKLWSLLMEKVLIGLVMLKMRQRTSNSGSDSKDKSRLRYGSQIHDGVLSYDNEIFASVFDSRSSDVEDTYVNDRFAKFKGMHAVHPLMTGNYMPPKSDVESKPKVVNEPKVWSDAPIIEEYESDSNDEYVSKASVE